MDCTRRSRPESKELHQPSQMATSEATSEATNEATNEAMDGTKPKSKHAETQIPTQTSENTKGNSEGAVQRVTSFLKNNIFRRRKHNTPEDTCKVEHDVQQSDEESPGEKAQMKIYQDARLKSMKILTKKFSPSRVHLSDEEILKDKEMLNELIPTHPVPKKVTELIINRCKLQMLPVNIGMLENIVILDLGSNSLEDLPWSLAFLKQLDTLNLSDNYFRRLPKVISRLRNLTYLNVESNLLATLPTSLLNLQNLSQFKTHNNKLPACLSDKPLAAIFDEILKRSNRKNEWKTAKPWITTEETPAPVNGLNTLWEICIEVILKMEVDFAHVSNVPPKIKNHLSCLADEHAARIQLAKCNNCSGYFSTLDSFENHNC